MIGPQIEERLGKSCLAFLRSNRVWLTKDKMDFMLYNEPLTDIRLKIYERQYPGSVDDIGKIFNTHLPTPKEVGEWKTSWVTTTPSKLVISNDLSFYYSPDIYKAKCHVVAKQLGIHPYFWEYWHAKEGRRNISGDDDMIGVNGNISFFFDEHLIMFKLAWDA
jgi:hypothetical protein